MSQEPLGAVINPAPAPGTVLAFHSIACTEPAVIAWEANPAQKDPTEMLGDATTRVAEATLIVGAREFGDQPTAIVFVPEAVPVAVPVVSRIEVCWLIPENSLTNTDFVSVAPEKVIATTVAG